MNIKKEPPCPHLVRKVPRQFSWIDHRLVRNDHICNISHGAAALYLFLVTVSDARGLSYYGSKTLQNKLGMDAMGLSGARHELVQQGLIAWKKPVYQVLPLDIKESRRSSSLKAIGEILQRLQEKKDD